MAFSRDNSIKPRDSAWWTTALNSDATVHGHFKAMHMSFLCHGDKASAPRRLFLQFAEATRCNESDEGAQVQ